MSVKSFFILVFASTFMFACNFGSNNSNASENTADANVIAAPANLNFELVKVHTHDTTSYTEGLEWSGNTLIESTGNYNQSKLRLLDSNMKDIVKPVKLSAAYFGEGATLFNGKIYQLTWKEHKVFVYDAKTLSKINEYAWPYEGWGMTHNDTAIILNTGGSNLYYVDPSSFKVIRTVGVYNNYGYVSNINELEYVDGKLYGNIYMTDNIIQIDPISGRVIAIADMSNILAIAGVKNDPRVKDSGYVLNGIAYNKAKGTFFITGKNWPVMVELRFK